MNNKLFKPTYLYIKRHSITGKCYFGKTTRKDPVKYLGSGTDWLFHIKEHGIEFVETLWFKLFIDKAECTRIALLFSEQQDIVKSKIWLNKKVENGRDGGATIGNKNTLGYKPTLETRAKMSASRMGNKNSLGFKHTPETCAANSARMIGKKNGLGYKHTPEACAKISVSKLGNKNASGSKCTPENCASKSIRMMGNKYALGNKSKLGQKKINALTLSTSDIN